MHVDIWNISCNTFCIVNIFCDKHLFYFICSLVILYYSNIKNKYLLPSLIILGVFIILSISIYYSVIQEIKFTNSSNGNNILINIDKSMLQFSHYFHVPSLNQFMKFITEYGREYFWIIVIFMLFLFGGHDGKITTIIIIISFLIIIPVNIIIKDLVNRDRPVPSYDSFYTEPKSDKSYPSGHASIVSAGAASAYLFFRNSWKQKLITYFLIVEAGLVCFSRLYLGVHYPFDIIGGILLGSGLSIFVASYANIYERLLSKIKIKNKN